MTRRRWSLGALLVALLIPLLGPGGAQAAKKKRPASTYVYGLCGGTGAKARDLCRVDTRTRAKKKLARSAGTKEYDGVSVSLTGASMLLDYGGDMLRAGRDGRDRRKLDGFGDRPFISGDGRSAGWVQSYQVPICTSYPYFSCVQFTYYAAAVQRTGDEKSRLIGSGVSTAGWWRNRLVITDDPAEDANEGADVVCVVEDEKKDQCSRTIAADPTRALSSPATSPDGRYLAVVSEPKPLPEADQKLRGRIEIWSPATGRRLRILNESTEDTTPMFSPDGKRVAFQRGDDVFSVPTRGGRPTLISRDLTVTAPSWSRGR